MKHSAQDFEHERKIPVKRNSNEFLFNDVNEVNPLHKKLKNITTCQKHFDDSLSDEEEAKEENYSLDWFHSITHSIKEMKKSNHLEIEDSSLQLSIITHELGIRVLKSEEVKKPYLRLKDLNLANNLTFSENFFTEMIDKAVESSFEAVYEDHDMNLQKLQHEVSSSLKKLDTRELVKAIDGKTLKKLIHKYFPNIKPIEEIKLDNEVIIENIKKIYEEINENLSNLKQNKIRVNKLIKAKLKNYISSSILKEKIKEILIKLDSSKRITIENFAESVKKELEGNFVYTLHDALKGELEVNLYKVFKEAYRENSFNRKVLPNGYQVTLDIDYSITDLFAYLRLMHRSNIREIKNLEGKNKEEFGYKDKTLIRMIKFPNSKDYVLEEHMIFPSGARKDIVKNLSTYKNVVKEIEKCKKIFGMDDSTIAKYVIARINNDKEEESASESNVNELEFFLTNLTYLLFGTEVSRNPASILIHYMMLELIHEAQLTWKEALEQTPMSLEGAMEVSRWQHLNYPASKRYNYDKKTVLSLDDNTKKILTQSIQFETKIIKLWLQFKEVDQTNIEDYIEEIIGTCDEAFGIKVPIKEFIINTIFIIIRTSLGELKQGLSEKITSLGFKRLIILEKILLDEYITEDAIKLFEEENYLYLLIKIFQNSKDKFYELTDSLVINFVNAGTNLNKLNKIYDENKNKFHALIEADIGLELIEKKLVTFDELIEIYDDNKEKFDALCNTFSVKDFIKKGKCTFKQLSKLYEESEEKFFYIIENDHNHALFKQNITFTELNELYDSDPIRFSALMKGENTDLLISKGYSLKFLCEMYKDSEIFDKFINSEKIGELLEQKVKLDYLLEIYDTNEKKFEALINGRNTLGLVISRETTFKMLSKIYDEDEEKFYTFVDNDNIVELINIKIITFNKLDTLYSQNKQKFHTLLTNDNFLDLVIEKGISFNQLSEMYDQNYQKFKALVDNENSYNILLKAEIKFKEFSEVYDVNIKKFEAIINNKNIYKLLTNTYISFKKLSNLYDINIEKFDALKNIKLYKLLKDSDITFKEIDILYDRGEIQFEELYKLYDENKNKFEALIDNIKSYRIQKKAKISLKELSQLYDTNIEKFNSLINNKYCYKMLISQKVNFNELSQLYDTNIEKFNSLINNKYCYKMLTDPILSFNELSSLYDEDKEEFFSKIKNVIEEAEYSDKEDNSCNSCDSVESSDEDEALSLSCFGDESSSSELNSNNPDDSYQTSSTEDNASFSEEVSSSSPYMHEDDSSSESGSNNDPPSLTNLESFDMQLTGLNE
jgi:hypothetical protein